MPAASLPESLEAHRHKLEVSLQKLRKALDNWRTYSAEYEAFREELQALPESASREQMLKAGLDIDGTLVDERDIKTLLGDKENIRRTRDQVIAAVSHRISYVDDNVGKVSKQYEALQVRIEKLLMIAHPPAVENEEGLQIMDIREELDEDGNVVEATVNGKDPDAAVRTLDPEQLKQFEKFMEDGEKAIEKADEAVERAGRGASGGEPRITEVKEETPAPKKEETTPEPKKDDTPVPEPPKQEAKSEPKKDETPAPEPEKKEEPQPEPKNENPAPEPPKPADTTPTAPGAGEDSDSEDEIMKHESGGFVKVLPDPEVKDTDWVTSVPTDTPAESALRNEMLSYSMSELGAVVAEINLEESGDYYGYEEYTDDEDLSSENEDEYGRSKDKVVTESYRREMERLQQLVREREERVLGEQAAKKKAPVQQPNAKAAGKKGVRFAEELDIQDAPKPTVFRELPPNAQLVPDEEDALPYLAELVAQGQISNSGPAPPPTAEIPAPPPKQKGASVFKKEKAAAPEAPAKPVPLAEKKIVPMPASTLADAVLERAPSATKPPAPPAPPKKMSRFMAAKLAAQNPPADDDDDDDKPRPVLADTLVEKPPAPADAEVLPPDEMDVGIHRQEVAASFHRLRSNMIQKQGGFVAGEEELGRVPLDENGERVKVSRFKAARLRG